MERAIADFLVAALVPRSGPHVAGALAEAAALLAAHPSLAQDDLFAAATLGDADAVRSHLASNPALATAVGGPYQWDALTHLCFSRYLRLDRSRSEGFVAAARLLLDGGANANTGFYEPGHEPEPTVESVTYGAAGVAHHAALTQLLLEHGADPNDGETPYHAPESYDNSALAVLVESGRLSADSLATMLLRKADWHDIAGMRYLLTHGADPNRATGWRHTALQQAVRRDNSLDLIELLVEHGGDLALTHDPHTGTPLQTAARRGRADILALAKKRGIAFAPMGLDAFLVACATGDAVGANALLEETAGLRDALRRSGGAFLAEFAGTDNADGVRCLLDAGVPVNAVYATGDGYFDIARNSLAIHVAAWRASHATVALLIERGSPIDALDGMGRTPLQLAVRACVDSYWMAHRRPDSVRALLHAGASRRGIVIPTGYDAIDALLTT